MVPVGLAGTCDQHALERRLAMRRQQHLGGDRPARRLRRLDHHRLAAERREDMAIRRIAGQRDRDAIARLEQREERQDEARRRAGGDDDARRVDGEAIRVSVVPRDARAQGRDAERLGIAKPAGRERGPRRRNGGCRRRRGRLPHFHVDDATAGGLDAGRGRHHVHHHECRNIAARRRRHHPSCRIQHRVQVLDVTCKLRPAVAAFLRAHWFAEAPQSDVIVPR